MYDTYPKKVHGSGSGKKSGWPGGHGTSYPDTKPGCEDMTKKVKCEYQMCGGGSPAADSYPQRAPPSFPGLDGLPS